MCILYRKSITSSQLMLFPTFKNIFHVQSSNARGSSITKASIQNIVSHCFENHVNCNEKWFRGKLNASYKHKLL